MWYCWYTLDDAVTRARSSAGHGCLPPFVHEQGFCMHVTVSSSVGPVLQNESISVLEKYLAISTCSCCLPLDVTFNDNHVTLHPGRSPGEGICKADPIEAWVVLWPPLIVRDFSRYCTAYIYHDPLSKWSCDPCVCLGGHRVKISGVFMSFFWVLKCLSHESEKLWCVCTYMTNTVLQHGSSPSIARNHACQNNEKNTGNDRTCPSVIFI